MSECTESRKETCEAKRASDCTSWLTRTLDALCERMRRLFIFSLLSLSVPVAVSTRERDVGVVSCSLFLRF